MKKTFRLGTRGSPLALVQAQIVRDALLLARGPEMEECAIEIVPIRTTGDWNPSHKEKTFLELGGTKGLFTKEIEEALLSGMLDCAVHSMKDVSIHCPAGLMFAAILEREDPRDALLSPVAPCLKDLPKGARIGTSSLRRRAQVLALRPDVTVVPLRGNVDTRLRKLAADEADATILAVAGLARLGILDRAASIFDAREMLPSPAQGCLGLQIRADDREMRDWARLINHEESEKRALCERAVLRTLDGSCRVPIAALATARSDVLQIEALVARPDGSLIIRKSLEGSPKDPEALGAALGEAIRAEMPPDFFGDES